MRRMQDLTYLEAVRPISNASDFLNKANKIASVVFQNDNVSVLVTITDKEIEGEENQYHVGASPQFCRVFTPDGLRLPLLERYTIPATHSENPFSSAARVLREGKEVPKKHRDKRKTDDSSFDIAPLKSTLNKIQLEAGHPNPDDLRVKISQVSYRFLGEVANGGVELTLVPDIADEATAILVKQAKESAAVLGSISKGVAYPVSPQSLQIPFATLDMAAPYEQTERFLRHLSSDMSSIFPLYVRAHEPRISIHVSS